MTGRVVVVGSGLAGLACALHAVRAGARVIVLTKATATQTATERAQGGIAAALRTPDSPAAHAEDTATAGAHHGDPAAIRVLVDDAAARIDELRSLGVAFDLDATGALARGLEAAHRHPRILHAGGDATGAAVHAAVLAAVARSTIDLRAHTFAHRLVVDHGRVSGIVARTPHGDETIEADAVVLATGGAGQLYAHTTNPAVATADGVALALSAGARAGDLEFVQFHPTMLEDGFLISEAVRGEGAALVDDAGRRFVFDAHPDGELAPRDVVARAIHQAMRAQGGRPVRLDATRLRESPTATAAFLARRFPTIDREVRARGMDWAREPIPVTPGAHYLMGGVSTDLSGRTSVPGLFAVGEVACTGVHGANRLASNSLLEAAVFGARAGDAAAAEAERATARGLRPHPAPAEPHADPHVEPSAEPHAAPAFSRGALQQLMWTHVGLVRDEAGLAEAEAVLDTWARGAETVDAASSVRELEDRHLLTVARAVARAARARRHSIGAHWRRDDSPARPSDRRTTDDDTVRTPVSEGAR